jgi:choline dehydrogenase-like flavoprotein
MFMESLVSKGFPVHDDMFTTGETSHGCGHVVRTVHGGTRSLGADFITKSYRRDNITVITDMTVDKIVVNGEGGEKTAVGAQVTSKDGTTKLFTASREIIISAGAYCSPAILLRSGIGPKEELEKHGIESILNLPGVGQNLMDHVVSSFATLHSYLANVDSLYLSSTKLMLKGSQMIAKYITPKRRQLRHTHYGKTTAAAFCLPFPLALLHTLVLTIG